MAEGEQKKERIPAVYELVKEEPRPASNAGAGTQLYHMLEDIQKNPGEWYRVVTCNSRSGANGIKTNIEKGKREVPTGAGTYEFTTRTNFPEEGKSALFAMFRANDEG